MFNPYNFQMNQNILPPQQILQANGKASIDALRMSPNSSVLIADQTAPIVWRCISDGLGNVSAEAFDITPHKDESQVERENMNSIIVDMNNRLKDLEAKYESFTNRTAKQRNESAKTNDGNGSKHEKSSSIYNADGEY